MGQTTVVVLQGGLGLMRSHEKAQENQCWRELKAIASGIKTNWPEKEEAIFSNPFFRDILSAK